MKQRIILQNIDKPKNKGQKNEIEWVCTSLGLVNGRDTKNVSFKIIYKLLRLFSNEDSISTNELSKQIGIDPPSINHHIRKLTESGIVLREKKKIKLRGGSLSSAIEEIQRDSEKLFDRLLETSKKIDKSLNL